VATGEWNLPRVQAHLDQGLGVPPEDRAALDAARWAEHLRVRVPAPPLYSPVRRLAWERAYKAAAALVDEPKSARALVVPTWMSDNKSDEPSTAWRVAGVVLMTESKEWELLDVSAPLLARLVVDTQRLVYVEPAEAPVPSSRLHAHFGAYCVAYSGRVLTVRQIEKAESVELAPRPMSIVPPRSRRIELGLAASELTLPEFDAVTRAIGEGAFARPSVPPPAR
jgi:hypothetical protein